MNDILILGSDFYSDINPNNTQSCFTIDYENPLDYSEGCEVGIVEIIFPTNIKNCPLQEDKRRIYLGVKNPNLNTGKYFTLKNRIILPGDNYKSITELLSDINQAIETSNKRTTEDENRKMINFFYKDKYDQEYQLHKN